VDEQEYLLNLIKKGKPSARKVARAHVLLRAHERATDDEIAQALHLGSRPCIARASALLRKD
jgi:hypothetical protein